MDNRFDKLRTWLLFELILTVGIFGIFLNTVERGGSSGLIDGYYFGIILVFTARIVLLGRAFLNFTTYHNIVNRWLDKRAIDRPREDEKET